MTLTDAEYEALATWDSESYSCACPGACPRLPCHNDRDDLTTTVERIIAARIADHEAQIRDLLEEREELLTEIRRLQMGNHPAGRALLVPKKHGSYVRDALADDNAIALAEALTERDAEHEGGAGS